MIARLRLSIKHLLVLLFGSISLLAALPTYWYINHVYAGQLMSSRGGDLHDTASATASVLAANLRERQREVQLLAQSSLFKNAQFEVSDFGLVLERTKATFPQYSWMGLADTEGTVRASTGGILVGKSVKARPWYAQGLQGPYSGDLHEALLLTKLLPPQADGTTLQLIDFSEPVLDRKGQLRGVLGVHVDWSWAADVLKVMQPATTSLSGVETLIVNRDNQIIYPRKYSDTLKLPAELSIGRPTLPFLISAWSDGEKYVTSIVPVRDGTSLHSMEWRVVVRQPSAQAFQSLGAIQRVLLMAVLLSAVAFLALLWWGATLISRPLAQIADHARSIARGHETAPLTVEVQSREIHDLVEALQGMEDTLIKRGEALAHSNVVLEKTVAERTAELVKSNEELHRISRRDALTGLNNRLASTERLRIEFARMKRAQTPYAVLMMDIDYFKNVNDTFGHDMGDKVLHAVAQVLEAHLRESDFLARFGGEEFLVLLPNSTLNAAGEVAEKLRSAVAAAPSATGHPITLSIGLALATPQDSNEHEAVHRADSFLYRAKHAGRNQVAIADLV